jgi:methionyl-tRNA formyltransferase
VDVVFLGTNNVGFELYEWLCERESVDVLAMLTEKSQLSLVSELRPDVVVAIGFRHVVPPEILSVPEHGCINLHPGLLPYARGFNPNVWSIVEDVPAGVTLHYMDEGVDTGPIIATSEVDTRFDETGKDLYARLEAASIELFVETWPQIESGECNVTDQENANATYHTKGDFTDLCELDPEATPSVREFLDVLRALTFPPFNNAHIEIDGERYFVDVDITPAEETDDDISVGTLSSY